MMIALTAALKAGKVTQDATFSGSLFQSLGPRWKKLIWHERKATKRDVDRTGMVTPWIGTSVRNKDIGGTRETGKNFEDITTVEQSRRASREGRDVRERRSCSKFQDCGMTRQANRWTDSKRLVKVLLRGCLVEQMYSRIGRTRVL